MRAYTDGPSELVAACIQATDAAERSGDARLEVELRRDLGSNLAMAGHDGQARVELERVLEAYRAWGDATGEANTLRNLVEITTSPQDRLELTAQSVDAARRSGRSDVIAVCLMTHCGMLVLDGTIDELEAAVEEAAEQVAAAKADYLLPYLALNRAFVHVGRGRFDEALEAVGTAHESLDVMMRLMGAVVTAIAAAGANRRDVAREATDHFAMLALEHSDFVDTTDPNYLRYCAWMDEALAEMEARLSP
jgi:hypothetical protein